jgi:hypothetical protein
MSTEKNQRNAEMIKAHEEAAGREIESARRCPKSNKMSQGLANKRVSAWIDAQFADCGPEIEAPIAVEKLQILGLLSKAQTMESVPVVKERQV